MSELGISQMPVKPLNGDAPSMIHETDILRALVSGECTPDDHVSRAAAEMGGVVSLDDSLSKVQMVFDQNNIAVVVDHDEIVGIVGKIDVVEFLASRS